MSWQNENSEVLAFVKVAVAVTTFAKGTLPGKVATTKVDARSESVTTQNAQGTGKRIIEILG
jgi:hypothetical protein